MFNKLEIVECENSFPIGASGFINKQATIVDIYENRDNDLFIGTGDGKIRYWLNIGTKTNSIFSEQTDSNNPLNSFKNLFSGAVGAHFSD